MNEGAIIESWSFERTRQNLMKIAFLVVFPVDCVEQNKNAAMVKAIYSFDALKRIFGAPEEMRVVLDHNPKLDNLVSGWCPIAWVLIRTKHNGIEVMEYRTDFIPGVYSKDFYQVIE